MSRIAVICLFEIAACSASEVLTAGELSLILQTSIDAPQLQAFYHENELPNRKPLNLVLTHIPASGIRLNKFNMPVIISSAAECIPPRPCLLIKDVNTTGTSASVTFSYPTEGITGIISLQKKASRWVIDKTRIVER